MEAKTVTAQSLFDLAIQTGGTVESVFALALENDLSITGEINAGQSVDVNETQDKQIVDYYRIKNIKPATFSGQEILTLSGIGYMAIEENNIVS